MVKNEDTGDNSSGNTVPEQGEQNPSMASSAECDDMPREVFVALSCPRCNVRYVAYGTDAATTCPWCGGDLARKGVAPQRDVPEFVVPFSVGQEQALESLDKFVRNAFTPDDVEIQVNRAQAVYVPYWLFDATAWETIALFDNLRGPRWTIYWGVCQSAEAKYKDLPVSASSLMPQYYMEAAGQFSVDERYAPAGGFATGVIAESPCTSGDEKIGQAKELAQGTLHEWLLCESTDHARESVGVKPKEGFIAEQAAVNHGVEIIDKKGEARITDFRLCALPVWLLHCTYEGEETLFVVNGQTSACAGRRYLDHSKKTRGTVLSNVLVIISGVAIALCALVLLWMLQSNQSTFSFSDFWRVVVAILFFCVFLRWILGNVRPPASVKELVSVREMARGSRVLRPTREESITARWVSEGSKDPTAARRCLMEKIEQSPRE